MTIDELVVKLALDATGLKHGAKEAVAATAQVSKQIVDAADKGEKAQTGSLALIVKGWNAMAATQRRTAEATVQASRTMVGATEGVAQSGEKLIRTFGALFLLFAGAKSLKAFTTDMIGLDAAVGRAAQNMGQAPETLSGIGRAVERMGGSFDGAVGGLRGLSDAFEQVRTTGNSSIMEPMARLQGLSGKAITFGKDVHANFLSIADALHAMKDPVEANYLGRQILGDESLTNLAMGGSGAIKAAEAASPKITKDQAAAAQELQAKLAGVRQEFEGIGNAILMDFGPAMLSGLKWVKDLIGANKDLIETKVKEWVKDVAAWFSDHKEDIKSFGAAMGELVSVAGTIATAFLKQSPMMQALEVFAVLMGGRVLGAVSAVVGAMRVLGGLSLPAWAASILGLSGVMLGAGAAAGAMNAAHTDDYGRDAGTWGGDAADNGPNGAHLRHRKAYTPQSAGSRLWNWTKGKLGFGDDNAPVPTGAHDPLKDLIARHETGTTGAGGYDTAYDHAERGGPLAPPKPLTQMTIAEVLAYQREMKPKAGAPAFPVGRAQWVEKTLRGLTKGMDQGALFTPDLQEKLFDKSIANRMGHGAAGFRNEWDSLNHVGTGEIQSAIDGHRQAMANAKSGDVAGAPVVPAPVAEGTRGQYPDWMDERSKRELAAVNAPLARDLIAAAQATGQRFKVAQGMRTPEEAAGNAASGSGVRNSQHLYGAAADIHLLDANGNVTYDRAAYRKFGASFQEASKASGGQGRWLGNVPGRWGRDIVHFDQGIGYGQSHTRDPYGVGGPTKTDVAEGNRDAYASPQNPFTKAKPLPVAADSVGSSQPSPASPAEKPLPVAAVPVTVDHAMRHVLKVLADSRRLTAHNDNHPVAVEMTDRSAQKVGQSGADMLFHRRWGGQKARVDHILGHTASLDRMTRVAAMGAYSHTVNRVDRSSSSDTRIGAINVHTAATDAKGIAADIEPHLHRGQAAGRADYGLA